MDDQNSGFTAEEQEALAAMQADDGSDETTDEPEQPQEAPQDGEATDDSRNEEAPAGQEKPEPVEREKPPEGFVPHQAMHAERVKRQELERQLKELQDWKASQENPPEKAPEYVDPLVDPEAFRKWAEHQSQSTQQRLEAEQRQRQQSEQAQQRAQTVQRMEAEFAERTPDYGDAVEFFQTQAVSQLQQQGFGEQEIRQEITRYANGLFDAASAAGINPAQLLYMRAQEAGYQPKKAEAPQPSETDRMLAQAKAQDATKGLGSGGGAPADGRPTAKQIADMSPDEIAGLSEADFRRAMGG